MIGRKEVPLDVLVLVCLHLSIYYCNEIKIAFANAGNYRLKPEFRMYHIDVKWIKTRDSVEPNEIIKLLKQDKTAFNKVLAAVVTDSNNESVDSETERDLSLRGSDTASGFDKNSTDMAEEDDEEYRPIKKTHRNKGLLSFFSFFFGLHLKILHSRSFGIDRYF